MAEIQIRRATMQHETALAGLFSGVWFAPLHHELVERAMSDPTHLTLLAEVAGQSVGLVDCFQTVAADGTQRWEVDLLAVLPEARQQGVGARLVAAATEHGTARGCTVARALVREENVASQRTFTRCGYRSDRVPHTVYRWWSGRGVRGEGDEPFHLFPVQTLTYLSYWLEPPLTEGSIAAAQRAVCERGGGSVGAVVPLSRPHWIRAAARSGFTVTDKPFCRYHWWEWTLQPVGGAMKRKSDREQ